MKAAFEYATVFLQRFQTISYYRCKIFGSEQRPSELLGGSTVCKQNQVNQQEDDI